MGINDILAAIDNMKRVGKRNIQDVYRDPQGALSKIAHNVKEQLGTEEGAKEFLYNSMTPGVGGIIKSKGGNWLTGSVEKALGGLKKLEQPRYTHINERGQAVAPEYGRPMTEPELAEVYGPANANGFFHRNKVMNKWIEGPLTKYVKRDMATEGDPVRKLAEQGILHYEPPMGISSHVYGERGTRAKMKMPEQGVGDSDLARSWEDASDSSLNLKPASYYQQGVSDVEPWLLNAPSETPIFQVQHRTAASDLGFNHLTDELANALNPESGLPRHLLLRPEQMEQMGIEKAVRHVAEINAWRAAQKAEADAIRANNAATRVHKEYAENNPKGLRWVELKAREPKATSLSRADADQAALRQELQDALKYEGDTMGHCVGGYCDRVLSGDTRIFSLRDAKGQPHVTIETRPGKPDVKYTLENLFDLPKDTSAPVDSIIQIKGKQNRTPNEEYLPFVQDFVKSGKWSDVGDLQNTGLVRVRPEMYPEANLGDYATQSELDAWLSGRAKDAGVENFAEGGLVSSYAPEPTWQALEGGYILR